MSRPAPTLALLAALAGCAAPWRARVVDLEVEGVTYRGDRTNPSSWRAEAVSLGEGLVAAPAHLLVGARSVRLGAQRFDTVVHLDRAAELVVLATATARPPADCAPGAEGVVAGDAPGDIAHHDGLVVDEASGCFMGTAVRGLFVPRPALSAVAGKPLEAVLSPSDLAPLVEVGASRRACLAPGEALKIAVGTAWPSVLTVRVRPEGDGVGAALVEGNNVAWKGVADGATLLAFDRREGDGAAGPASVVVVNPARATARVCATVDVGEVAWERPLGRRLRSASAPPLDVRFEVGPALGGF